MELTIVLEKIKPKVSVGGSWYARLEDADGKEYLTNESYPFAAGTTLVLMPAKSFRTDGEKPEYGASDARWRAYYESRLTCDCRAVSFVNGQAEHYALYRRLCAYVCGTDALRLLEQYATDLLSDRLENNPYWFYSDIHGFAYDNFRRIDAQQTVDTFELRLEQVTCAVSSCLRKNEQAGHTWMPVGELLEQCNWMLRQNDGGELSVSMRFLDALLNYEDRFYYDAKRVAFAATYQTEAHIEKQVRILCHIHPLSPEQIILSDHLCEEQRAAVRGIVDAGNLSILTGKPGTGKTTAIADILRQYLGKKSIATLAPTGRAASRVWEALQQEFSADQLEGIIHCTIAKFLGQGAPSFLRAQSLRAAKDIDLLIVDETSMVDIFQMAELFDAIDVARCKVILVGDKNQLPSIAAGNVLTDLIAIGVPCFYLEENHRSVHSIFDNATRILENSRDAFVQDDHFRFLPSTMLDTVLETVDFSQMQVLFLTPYRSVRFKGSTTGINASLRQRYFGTDRLCIGSKVICTKNNYKAGYFNGEMGIVCAITEEGVHVMLSAESTIIAKPDEVETAYALTIHKAQGSEADDVYIYLPDCLTGKNFLSKELLYTAVTRAKMRVTIIGSEEALREVMQVLASDRRTFLPELYAKQKEASL